MILTRQDLAIIQENIKIVKLLEKKREHGYYRNLSLKSYNTFHPPPYPSLEAIIKEIIKAKGACAVLEIGCGIGRASSKLAKKLCICETYDGLDVIRPKYQDFNWIEEDMDQFQPEKKYDFISSINGLVYGYNALRNYFKCANALSAGGKFLFNFDGMTNTNFLGMAPVTKTQNSFYEIMNPGSDGRYFLDSLCKHKMPSYLSNFLGRQLYFGCKTDSDPIDSVKVMNCADELREEQKTSFVKKFQGKQSWIYLANNIKWEKKMILALTDCLLSMDANSILCTPGVVAEEVRKPFVRELISQYDTLKCLIDNKMPMEYFLKESIEKEEMKKRDNYRRRLLLN